MVLSGILVQVLVRPWAGSRRRIKIVCFSLFVLLALSTQETLASYTYVFKPCWLLKYHFTACPFVRHSLSLSMAFFHMFKRMVEKAIEIDREIVREVQADRRIERGTVLQIKEHERTNMYQQRASWRTKKQSQKINVCAQKSCDFAAFVFSHRASSSSNERRGRATSRVNERSESLEPFTLLNSGSKQLNYK